ncbi:uncharacterized protein RJT20DRAFT_53839 [Scheffersomyces xylosifermentans]|uniref:uncharacterized protein n=1 Tax=Scheffersomyces xylosifermentans TaxID=1304137 RepID=UPI00315DA2D7
MVGFPAVPRVVGDTDDDASIHLHTYVGPAKPLPKMRTAADEKIYRELYKSKEETLARNYDSEDDEEEDLRNEIELNESFSKFQQSLSATNLDQPNSNDHNGDIDVSDSDTYNESSDDEDSFNENSIFNKAEDVRYAARRENSSTNNADIGNVSERSVKEYYNTRDTSRYSNNDETQYKSFEEEDYGQKGASSEVNRVAEEAAEPEITETIDDKNSKSKIQGTSPRSNEGSNLQYAFFAVLSFILTLVAVVVYQTMIAEVPYESRVFGSNLRKVENKIDKISKWVSTLEKRHDMLESTVELVVKNQNEQYDITIQRFEEVETRLVGHTTEFIKLRQQLNEDIYTDQNKLEEINDKLAKLVKANDDIDSLKQQIVNELVNKLPDHIPVYIKNDRIHFKPAFHKYLFNFIESYGKNLTGAAATPDWDQFLSKNTGQLDELISKQVTESSTILKEKLEGLVQRQMSEFNQNIIDKFNHLVDSLNVEDGNSDSPLKTAATPLLLSQLAEILAKGSIKVNYADYNLGARILGFLTQGNSNNARETQPFFGRILFGWYHYLSMKSPREWKYNANNVLLDNESSWNCELDSCSIGIRLFNQIILTDVIIKSRNMGRVSLWVKPRSQSHYDKLHNYQKQFKVLNDKSSNRYLRKFLKISEHPISSGVTHLEVPVKLVSLAIPLRDIYLEFIPIEVEEESATTNITSTSNGHVSRAHSALQIDYIKVYGISEVNAYKSDQHLNSLLTQSRSDDTVHDHTESNQGVDYLDFFGSNVEDGLTLGDDEET